MNPTTDPLDEFGLRLAELEATAMRAGDELRAANRRIDELTYQRETILIAAAKLGHEMRTQCWVDAWHFLSEVDELCSMAAEVPPWTMPT